MSGFIPLPSPTSNYHRPSHRPNMSILILKQVFNAEAECSVRSERTICNGHLRIKCGVVKTGDTGSTT